jgi:hypothetical protein
MAKKAAAPSPNVIRDGMHYETYDAVVDLQVSVRNAIGRPVTMLEALRYSRLRWHVDVPAKKPENILKVNEFFQSTFDLERSEQQQQKKAEQETIARTAGKRNVKG